MTRRLLVTLLVAGLVAGGIFLVRAAVTGETGDRRATEPAAPPASPGELTPREVELTRLTEDDFTRVLTPDSIPSIDDPIFLPVGEAAAYPYEDLRAGGEAGVIHDTLGEQDLVVFWKAGVAWALDTTEIARGRDVGSSGVFVPQVGRRELRFEAKGGAILDRQTGSTWSLAGEAVSGPMKGARLPSVSHLDTFWFAWAAHHPETAISGR